MSIFNTYASKDTALVWHNGTGSLDSLKTISGSNAGKCEIIPLITHYEEGYSGSGHSRVIIQFDLGNITPLYNKQIKKNNFTASLYLYNAGQNDPYYSGSTISLYKLDEDWDEGSGIDIDNFEDQGFANWKFAKREIEWNNTGALADGSILYDSASLEFGNEDVKFDITEIVKGWLNEDFTNYGVLIKFSGSQEVLNYESTFRKQFYSAQSNTVYKPRLEIAWDDVIQDDRNYFYSNEGNSLYLYNIRKGELKDINKLTSGSVQDDKDGIRVYLYDTGTSAYYSASASWDQTGIYKLSNINFDVSSSWNDKWYSGSQTGTALMSQYITSSQDIAYSTSIDTKDYDIRFMNLHNKYLKNSIEKIELFIKEKYPNLGYSKTLDNLSNTILYNGYYRVKDLITGDIWIDFSNASKISYDTQGCYFKLYMKSFIVGRRYKIDLKFYVNGNELYFERDNWIFETE